MKRYRLWELRGPKIVLDKGGRHAVYDLDWESQVQMDVAHDIRAKSLDGALAQVKKKYPGQYIEVMEITEEKRR